MMKTIGMYATWLGFYIPLGILFSTHGEQWGIVGWGWQSCLSFPTAILGLAIVRVIWGK